MKQPIGVQSTQETTEGAGVTVKRLMPVVSLMNFDPFVLWDHFVLEPGTGFPEHPHRGFEAITYMFDGSMHHKDNLGNESMVTAGGVQRFTAGSGMVHSEMPGATGKSTGIQCWINLPSRLKKVEPTYQQVDAHDIPEHIIENGKIRVIVGDDSPVKLQTPVRYLDITFDRESCYKEVIQAGFRGFVYMVSGDAKINGQETMAGDACFLETSAYSEINDDSDNILEITSHGESRCMVFFGAPHHELIKQHGSFVD